MSSVLVSDVRLYNMEKDTCYSMAILHQNPACKLCLSEQMICSLGLILMWSKSILKFSSNIENFESFHQVPNLNLIRWNDRTVQGMIME